MLIAYMTLYLLQSVNSQMPDAIEESEDLPEHTLFPKNGPVFMRRIFTYHTDSPLRTRTEPTVVFNGTLSMPVWKIVDVTLPPSTSTGAPPFDVSMLNALVISNRDAALTNPSFMFSPDPRAALRKRPPSILPGPNINPSFMFSPDPRAAHRKRPPSMLPGPNIRDGPLMYKPNNPSMLNYQGYPKPLQNPFESNTSNSSETTNQDVATSPDPIYAAILADQNSLLSIMKPTITSTPSVEDSLDSNVETTSILDATSLVEPNPSKILLNSKGSVSSTLNDSTPLIVTHESETSQKTTKTSTSSTATTFETSHPASDTTLIADIRTPGLLRMPSPETTTQTLKQTFASKQTTTPTTTSTTTTTTLTTTTTTPRTATEHIPILRFEPKQSIQVSASTQKIDHGATETEPFSMFLRRLLNVLLTKDIPELETLIKAFEIYLTILVDTGKLMKLGSSTCLYIAQATRQLRAPIIELQKQMFMGKLALESRRKMLSDEVNAILDDMDDVYDVNEEEAMQRVLSDIGAYPFAAGRSGEQIVTDFVNTVFVYPMHRVAGTARGNKLFGRISILASKNNVNNIRRFLNNDNKFTKPFTEHRVFNRQYRTENKLIDIPTSGDFVMRDREKLKKKRKSLYPIPANKNLPKSVKIYSIQKLKGQKLMNIYSSSASEEAISNSDDNGVEIRIKIKNGKYSKVINE